MYLGHSGIAWHKSVPEKNVRVVKNYCKNWIPTIFLLFDYNRSCLNFFRKLMHFWWIKTYFNWIIIDHVPFRENWCSFRDCRMVFRFSTPILFETRSWWLIGSLVFRLTTTKAILSRTVFGRWMFKTWTQMRIQKPKRGGTRERALRITNGLTWVFARGEVNISLVLTRRRTTSTRRLLNARHQLWSSKQNKLWKCTSTSVRFIIVFSSFVYLKRCFLLNFSIVLMLKRRLNNKVFCYLIFYFNEISWSEATLQNLVGELCYSFSTKTL